MKKTRFGGIYSYETQRGLRYAVWASTGSGRQRTRKGLRTLAEARAAKQELEHAGTAPARMRLNQFLQERWLPSLTSKPNSRRVAALYCSHISEAIGDVRLQRLESLDVEEFLSWLDRRSPPLSTNTKHAAFKALRQALRHALRKQLIATNPASRDYVDAPPTERRKPAIAMLPTPVMVEAVEALLRVADGTRFGFMVRLPVMTGLREKEVFGLEWRDIDFATGWVHIRRETTKTDSSERDVFLDSELLERLRTLRAEQMQQYGEPVPTHVFLTQTRRPWTQHTFWRHWNRIRRAVELSDLHYHDLRHVHSTLMERANVHGAVMANRLGHADQRMTARYTHAERSEQEAAVAAVARLFGVQTE